MSEEFDGRVLNPNGVEIDLSFWVFKRLKRLHLLEQDHASGKRRIRGLSSDGVTGLNVDLLLAGAPGKTMQSFACREQVVVPGLTIAYTWAEDSPETPPGRGKDFWPAFLHLLGS